MFSTMRPFTAYAHGPERPKLLFIKCGKLVDVGETDGCSDLCYAQMSVFKQAVCFFHPQVCEICFRRRTVFLCKQVGEVSLGEVCHCGEFCYRNIGHVIVIDIIFDVKQCFMRGILTFAA